MIHSPDQNVMFTGDIVEYHSACYCGDGHFLDWGDTLDSPLTQEEWLVEKIQGEFTLIGFGDLALPEIDGLARLGIGHKSETYPSAQPKDDAAVKRYDERMIYLIRPDGYIAAAFRKPDEKLILKTFDRATGIHSKGQIH